MIRGIGGLTVYSRIILWVQPPVKELPTFPFLGFYSHNVTARHGIKKEAPSCAWRKNTSLSKSNNWRRSVLKGLALGLSFPVISFLETQCGGLEPFLSLRALERGNRKVRPGTSKRRKELSARSYQRLHTISSSIPQTLLFSGIKISLMGLWKLCSLSFFGRVCWFRDMVAPKRRKSTTNSWEHWRQTEGKERTETPSVPKKKVTDSCFQTHTSSPWQLSFPSSFPFLSDHTIPNYY